MYFNFLIMVRGLERWKWPGSLCPGEGRIKLERKVVINERIKVKNSCPVSNH
jgi:hypothetical protein